MDGVHDLGGVQGFGAVPHQVNDDLGDTFHAEWEHLPYSLLFLGAADLELFSVDELRHSIERIEPRQYISSSYYDRILVGTASLMVEKGLISHDELEMAAGGPFNLSRALESKGRPARDDTVTFEVGERVTVRNEFVRGHIRVPAYCRGRTGTITHRTTEKWPFPDSIGHGRTDAGAESTYHVEFNARDLFGNDTDAGSVMVDLFEGYLDHAMP